MTKMNFELLLPHLRPWVMNLVNVWPAYIVKPHYAAFEVSHIISLVLLGGTAILLSLRLLGVGITEEPPSEIYRNLRRWQDVGVAGIVISGVLIGMANAEKLYDSSAFLVKMICLASGIILTYGASRPVARTDGEVSTASKIWFAIGGLMFLVGLYIFATGNLINVGLYHVLTAAALIVLYATKGRLRWIYLAILLVLIGVQEGMTHLMYAQDDIKHLDPINKVFSWLFTLWIFGCALAQLLMTPREQKSAVYVRLIAWASILVWICGGAAGRWIAFE
jgi:hypothetical protein